MPRKLALLIGCRTFEDTGLARLSAPWDDVETLGNVLRDNGGFEVDKQADLGLGDIQEAIQHHFQAATEEDTVLLYYTGHGLRDTNGHDLFLALRRTRLNAVRATSLKSAFIREEMDLSRARRQILILDCCHSGAFMGGAETAKRGAQTLVEADVLNPGGTGRYVLAASAANESAFERDGRSIYTEFMVEALRTGAAAPEKTEVTVDDLHDYLVRRVGDEDVPMRPHIWKSAATRPMVIARNPDPRKPIPPELVEGLFDTDVLRAQGAVSGLLRLRGGADERLARDAEKVLHDRLRKTDDLLSVVADEIRAGLRGKDEEAPMPPARPLRAFAAVGLASLAIGGVTDTMLVGTAVDPFKAFRPAVASESVEELAALHRELNKLAEERDGLDRQLAGQKTLTETAQKQAIAATATVSDLQGSLERVTGEHDRLRAEVDRQKDLLESLETREALASGKVVTLGKDLERLTGERDRLKQELSRQTERARDAEAQAKAEADKAASLETQRAALQQDMARLTDELAAAREDAERRKASTERDPLSTFQDCDDCPTMVVIPGGTFTMGSPKDEVGHQDDEGPLTDVTVRDFALARSEVTFDQWQACVDDGGCTSNRTPDDRGWGTGDRPVINVSWHQAQEFIDWLNTKVPEGYEYSLPSEAQWEYAARATTISGVPGTDATGHKNATLRISTTAYPWGNVWDADMANGAREVGKPVEVGQYPANGFGLFDMHGNVWEWTKDCWIADYASHDGTDAPRLEADGGDCTLRAVRGGSWDYYPRGNRSANRLRGVPGGGVNVIGFRPARTPLTPYPLVLSS